MHHLLYMLVEKQLGAAFISATYTQKLNRVWEEGKGKLRTAGSQPYLVHLALDSQGRPGCEDTGTGDLAG